MLHSIQEIAKRVRLSGGVLNAYRVAEEIQLKHPLENIALEDIVQYIIDHAFLFPAIELTPDLEGEFMMPVNEVPADKDQSESEVAENR
jgi:hypothetical protein